MNGFEKFLNKYLAPIANKMNANTFFSTLKCNKKVRQFGN